MPKDTRVSPAVPAAQTGQSLISHAGLGTVPSLLDATGFGTLAEAHFSRFVPKQATHRPGRSLGCLASMLAGGGDRAAETLEAFEDGSLRSRARCAHLSGLQRGKGTPPSAWTRSPLTSKRHSKRRTDEKEVGAGTYKCGYGLAPMSVSIDYGLG